MKPLHAARLLLSARRRRQATIGVALDSSLAKDAATYHFQSVRGFLEKHGRQSWPGGRPPPWPDGELPPWREEDRPSIIAVLLAYPGMALGIAFLALIVGGILSAFLLWGIFRVFHVLLWGPAAVPVFLLVIGALWWYLLDGAVRGWWAFGGDE